MKMKTIKLITLGFFTLGMVSCSEAQDATKSKEVDTKKTETTVTESFAKNVSASEFQKLIKGEGSIIDVRTPGEFSAGYIEGATNINIYDAAFNQKVSKLDKNKPVYLYCRSGGRSGNAMRKMKSMGFTKLYNLTGGFNGWSGKGLPSVK